MLRVECIEDGVWIARRADVFEGEVGQVCMNSKCSV